MSSENQSQWSTGKVIALGLLACSLAFYAGSRLDLFRVSRARSETRIAPTPNAESSRTEQVKRVETPQYFRVGKVIDGDILTLDDGTEVNLIGVSCPKLDDPDPLQVALAREAVAFTTGAVTGKQVRLEYETAHSLDGHGRTLAFVYLQDRTLLNAELIKHGYGTAFTRYNYRFIDDFRKYELAARSKKVGQWEERSADDQIAQNENSSSDSAEVLPNKGASDEGNATNSVTLSSASSRSLTRPRVIHVPEVLPRESTDDETTPLQSSSNTYVETPSRSYSSPSSPSYISPSFPPASKPIVAENGSYYGEISERTGRPKTVHVNGYSRRDGTYVREHWRSPPR